MLPADFTLAHGAAIALLIAAWAGYAPLLGWLAKGTLNSQLGKARRTWMALSVSRDNRTFDAVLMGHIMNSVAFFGSATLIVLAGLVGTIANVAAVHAVVSGLHFSEPMSVEMFALKLAVVAFILTLSFFSFTYALRKLGYTIALVGALPEREAGAAHVDAMTAAAAAVLTDAVKSFNNGIRGYYYAVAALTLFVSPWVCIAATLAVMAMLFYRQTMTVTARAIGEYVAAMEEEPPAGVRKR